MTKIIIIGASSSGATCAARLRRLNIQSEIVIYEKRPYLTLADDSYLAYLKGEIPSIEALQLLSKPVFEQTRQLKIQLEHEVISVDPANKSLKFRDLATGEVSDDSYDILILATGSSIPKVNDRIYCMDDIDDLEYLKDSLKSSKQVISVLGSNKSAVELSHFLVEEGHEVHLISQDDRIMAECFDDDLSQFVQKQLYDQGIVLQLGEDRIPQEGLIISCLPKLANSKLAKDSGIKIGVNGGIEIDSKYQTSVNGVYAIGSCVNSAIALTDSETINISEGYKQQSARKLANQLLADSEETSKPYLRSMIVSFGAMKYGAVGMTCQECEQQGIDYDQSLVIPGDMLRLRPEARPKYYKLIFEMNTGKILGLQVMAYRDVSKDLDTVSLAIFNNNSVYDMKEYQLSYSPEYGNPKEASNMAALNAINIIEGRVNAIMFDEVREIVENHKGVIFDTRSKAAYEAHHIIGSKHMSYENMLEDIKDLPKDQPIYLYCTIGQRSAYMVMHLRQLGYTHAYNIQGSILPLSFYEYYRDHALGRKPILNSYYLIDHY
ncbi:FAD-dependent oxidoreductase [Facklamia hominis]|uniref:FAD-dependent oxidoreductase n=1 Tax=Facklamia hominis TaxID=178214 RepID=UPI0038FD2A43